MVRLLVRVVPALAYCVLALTVVVSAAPAAATAAATADTTTSDAQTNDDSLEQQVSLNTTHQADGRSASDYDGENNDDLGDDEDDYSYGDDYSSYEYDYENPLGLPNLRKKRQLNEYHPPKQTPVEISSTIIGKPSTVSHSLADSRLQFANLGLSSQIGRLGTTSQYNNRLNFNSHHVGGLGLSTQYSGLGSNSRFIGQGSSSRFADRGVKYIYFAGSGGPKFHSQSVLSTFSGYRPPQQTQVTISSTLNPAKSHTIQVGKAKKTTDVAKFLYLMSLLGLLHGGTNVQRPVTYSVQSQRPLQGIQNNQGFWAYSDSISSAGSSTTTGVLKHREFAQLIRPLIKFIAIQKSSPKDHWSSFLQQVSTQSSTSSAYLTLIEQIERENVRQQRLLRTLRRMRLIIREKKQCTVDVQQE